MKSNASVDSKLIPAIVKSAQQDPIPNVRFNAAKVFEQISTSLEPTVLTTVVQPCLTEMKNDSDSDKQSQWEERLLPSRTNQSGMPLLHPTQAKRSLLTLQQLGVAHRIIAPEFDRLSEEYPNVVFLKVDVDEVEAVAAACGISAMPTFQVWKNGAKVDELVGASKDKLKELVAKNA
eukprot:jgi/Picre1/34900/NNA_002366.t1